MKFLLILCAFSLLVSCTFEEHISLYNNTGSELIIKQSENNEERVVIINEGGVLSFKENEIISFKNSSIPYGTFDLTLNGVVLSYQWNYFKSSYFMRREGFGPFSRIVYRFQIENDGRIYILRRTDEFILKDLSDQPIGFPLQPTRKPEPRLDER